MSMGGDGGSSSHDLEAELEVELDIQSERQARGHGNAVDCSTSLPGSCCHTLPSGARGASPQGNRPLPDVSLTPSTDPAPRSTQITRGRGPEVETDIEVAETPAQAANDPLPRRYHPATGSTGDRVSLPSRECGATSSSKSCDARELDSKAVCPTSSEGQRCNNATTSGTHDSSVQRRPRIRNLKTADRLSGRPRRSAATLQGNAPLDQLPFEVLSHLFRYVGASDLTSCARVCAAFRAPASEDALWRRLYCARWRSFRGNRRMARHHFWKLSYLDRDREDYVRNVLLNGGEHGPAYHAMHLTERAAPVRANEEPTWGMDDTSAQDQLDSYMRAKGFRPGVCKPSDVNAMRLIRFGDYYVDEESGWVHLCDATCDTQAPDAAGAFMVCPVTGRMHGQVPENLVPGDGAADVDVADEVEAADPITTDVGGWLASVYEAGYRHNDDDNKNESMVSLNLS